MSWSVNCYNVSPEVHATVNKTEFHDHWLEQNYSHPYYLLQCIMCIRVGISYGFEFNLKLICTMVSFSRSWNSHEPLWQVQFDIFEELTSTTRRFYSLNIILFVSTFPGVLSSKFLPSSSKYICVSSPPSCTFLVFVRWVKLCQC